MRVLGEVDDMEASLSHSKLSPKGNVKISLPQVMAKSTIIPALPQFFKLYLSGYRRGAGADGPAGLDLVEEVVDCVVRVGAVGDIGLGGEAHWRLFADHVCVAGIYRAIR